MNTNNHPRSLIVPILAAVALAAAIGAGVYWWPKDPPLKDPPVVKNGGDKDKDKEKKPGPGTNGDPVPKVEPVVHDVKPVSLSAAVEFLHSGPTPVQTDLDPLILDAKRTAALRGLVFKNDKEPFPGVKVAIQNQPRYGKGASRDDGSYDMVVNGGGLMTVGFTRDGYLPVWRQTAVPWQDYTWLPPVVMTTTDATVTLVKADSKTQQVARATKVKDKDGERQTTLIFPSGTKATMVLPDGSTKKLDSLNVRATEYTVGAKGPDRMPAPLPANSAYTYCIELSADEAIKAGAKTVRFDKPVYHYVENFLNFPVGIPVPTGYFDPDKGAWVASKSGRVIKILAIVNGLADLDIDGKGKAADAKALEALKVTSDERAELGRIYAAGTTLWRVPIPHFSIWDCNWGFSPPKGAVSPRLPTPLPGLPDKPQREKFNVPGIAWLLHYHSDRTPGAIPPRTIRIPTSGPTLPTSCKHIVIEIYICGRRIEVLLPAQPDQVYVFVWDGKDVFGRLLHGNQNVKVRIGYVYDGVYEQNAVFGADGNGEIITGSRTRQEIVLWQEHQVVLGYFDARTFGLGGWSFDVQHAYDPVGRILHLGNGERHDAGNGGAQIGNLVISTVAGAGKKKVLGDGGPARESRLDNPNAIAGAGMPRSRFSVLPRGLAVAPDGTLFIAGANQRIRRVDTDGKITTVAGGGTKDVDTGKAADMSLQQPGAIALGPDGSLFIAEGDYTHRIRRLDTNGTMTTIAGGNGQGFSGDGGSALKAQFKFATGLAVAPDGTLYIADQGSHRIRRVTPDGIITTIAGTGAKGYAGDNGSAVKAQLYWPTSLALGPDGSLYVSDSGNYVVRRVSTSGIITTVAGTFLKDWSGEFGGDDGPSLKAKFNDPTGLAVAADGSLYIADTDNHRIRCVGPDGIIRTLAGVKVTDHGDFSGDDGPARLAKLSYPTALALGPDGSLFFYDASFQSGEGSAERRHIRQRVRRISPPMPGFSNTQIAVPSPDGKELFKFNAVGQHLETLDAVTKAVRVRLDYDAKGRLKEIMEPTGSGIKIDRDEYGRPQEIVAKDQKTSVKLDANGFLERVIYPDGEQMRMSSSPDGLLKSLSAKSRSDKK